MCFRLSAPTRLSQCLEYKWQFLLLTHFGCQDLAQAPSPLGSSSDPHALLSWLPGLTMLSWPSSLCSMVCSLSPLPSQLLRAETVPDLSLHSWCWSEHLALLMCRLKSGSTFPRHRVDTEVPYIHDRCKGEFMPYC